MHKILRVLQMRNPFLCQPAHGFVPSGWYTIKTCQVGNYDDDDDDDDAMLKSRQKHVAWQSQIQGMDVMITTMLHRFMSCLRRHETFERIWPIHERDLPPSRRRRIPRHRHRPRRPRLLESPSKCVAKCHLSFSPSLFAAEYLGSTASAAVQPITSKRETTDFE